MENKVEEQAVNGYGVTPVQAKMSRLERLKNIKPSGIKVSEATILMEPLYNDKSCPIVFRPGVKNIDIFKWLENNHDEVENCLRRYGAILFRGFGISTVDSFEHFLKSLGSEILEYKHRSSPRHEIQNHIYTSTDHPADQFINMHNEHSYSHEWPLKIIFCCITPSATGGETPVADSRMILKMLSPETRLKFIERGVRYVRNMGTGLGMDWKKVFQTEDKQIVENYCKKYNVDFSWGPDDRLRLEFVRPAVRMHPVYGEESWFNHAFFFNILSLEESLRKDLMENGSPDIVPFLTYYGDGTAIESSVIEEIRAAYNNLMVTYKWMKGDVLVLDNMYMAHGRMPFEGERQILVGMLQPFGI
jgi:alpha-ketoglutarate-dependent taurine dioxygenase